MKVDSFDHVVLCVQDVSAACRFYAEVLGMDPREERPGKWSLHFGQSKISLQESGSVPEIARNTKPGTGNFCLVSETSIERWMSHLEQHEVALVAGPGERAGAVGTLLSVYFHDPDGNLVEISNRI